MTEKIIKYKNKTPIIKKNVFIADGSKVIGNVEINEDSSIWFNCVLRGDVDYIKIGKNTNIQDGTIIHVSSYGFSATGRNGSPTEIGDNVTIGHNATIHACKIDDNALIGMGSIVLDNAIINHMAFIAAGAADSCSSAKTKPSSFSSDSASISSKVGSLISCSSETSSWLFSLSITSSSPGMIASVQSLIVSQEANNKKGIKNNMLKNFITMCHNKN